MKNFYEKPNIEYIEFDIIESLTDDEGGDIGGGIGGGSESVEDW